MIDHAPRIGPGRAFYRRFPDYCFDSLEMSSIHMACVYYNESYYLYIHANKSYLTINQPGQHAMLSCYQFYSPQDYARTSIAIYRGCAHREHLWHYTTTHPTRTHVITRDNKSVCWAHPRKWCKAQPLLSFRRFHHCLRAPFLWRP